MQEYRVKEIVIPKEGIKVILLDEKGERKYAAVVTQEDIQLILRVGFKNVIQGLTTYTPKPPEEVSDTSIKT